MHSGCLRHTDLPGTSRLFGDFVYHWDRLAQFYEYNFQNPESYVEAARRIHYPAERRAALISALQESNPPSPELDLLARPDTVAVVTGQQVGLFSGPSYTIYKALTAARLAADLTARGIPAVPVFWLATEDHDFPEVNHCWVFGSEQHPVQLRVDVQPGDHQPAGEVEIAEFPTAALRRALERLPFGEDVASLVERSYRPGRTMGAAFRDLVRDLLGGLRMLYVDPMQPAIRELAAPLIRDAVEASPKLAEQLLARGRELEQAGYHAQVHFEDSTSLFFLLEGGRRLPLKRSGKEYFADKRRIRAEELAARADHLSPNALLRPVVQDYLLPTVAEIGGPAEVAYLAQSEAIYRCLGRATPVVAPRTGFTLLDARASKLMDRYHLEPKHFFDGFESLCSVISGRLVPSELRRTMQASRSEAEALLERMYAGLDRFDPTLAAALDKSRAKILYQFSKVEAKTAREAIRRDERASNESLYLYNLIYPNKHLQERVYTFLPFLARHGLGLVPRLEEAVRPDCYDHHVLEV
jgi:bacillithiol biosynthesis cysteine-adding enzyme BshC